MQNAFLCLKEFLFGFELLSFDNLILGFRRDAFSSQLSGRHLLSSKRNRIRICHFVKLVIEIDSSLIEVLFRSNLLVFKLLIVMRDRMVLLKWFDHDALRIELSAFEMLVLRRHCWSACVDEVWSSDLSCCFGLVACKESIHEFLGVGFLLLGLILLLALFLLVGGIFFLVSFKLVLRRFELINIDRQSFNVDLLCVKSFWFVALRISGFLEFFFDFLFGTCDWFLFTLFKFLKVLSMTLWSKLVWWWRLLSLFPLFLAFAFGFLLLLSLLRFDLYWCILLLRVLFVIILLFGFVFLSRTWHNVAFFNSILVKSRFSIVLGWFIFEEDGCFLFRLKVQTNLLFIDVAVALFDSLSGRLKILRLWLNMVSYLLGWWFDTKLTYNVNVDYHTCEFRTKSL